MNRLERQTGQPELFAKPQAPEEQQRRHARGPRDKAWQNLREPFESAAREAVSRGRLNILEPLGGDARRPRPAEPRQSLAQKDGFLPRRLYQHGFQVRAGYQARDGGQARARPYVNDPRTFPDEL